MKGVKSRTYLRMKQIDILFKEPTRKITKFPVQGKTEAKNDVKEVKHQA